jgi:allantoin racemase
MADPGLDAAREIASIPIVGLGEASLFLAAMLAHKFSVVTILDRDIPDLDRMFRKYDLLSKVASVRAINVPVLDIRCNENAVTEAATTAALRAVQEDGAAAIAFGCGGLSGVVAKIDASMKSEGFNIPVINPAAAGMKIAESLVDMGLIYSKITYPDPPEKKVIFP